MSVPFQGGCACGAVRFESTAEPVLMAHCHCTDCQKMTGAHMATIAAVPEAGFRVLSGEATFYDTTGDSGGRVHRGFCATCGSTLYSTADAMPGMVFVEAGSLDDASWVRPASHIFTRSAQPWANLDDELDKFETMPG